ncbi:sodium- and chloride-dependent glycine transporter 2-like [Eurytemora carolleeae]|uniref:sodium- and chloride-dependent glycine transporter 2-like n=1 Tax=Eurytemora carolleeae TaxID=1294199 RepID=UPI000C75E4B1|nr:sodium- and chloride-dependent glycine transporter 2-like [Eurytemora carolleeae]|eukprot:XP_023322005.1 sodium- and chloride-dependent glycine transporter 2-like [Eurytemora affinis]
MFILGLPFTCNGGIHMFNLFNSAAPSWNLLLFALLEVLLVSWLYGIDNFMENLYQMNIRMPNWLRLYWRFTLLYTTPIILGILLLVSWINSGHIGYNGKDYPFGIQALGSLVTGSTVICLPLVAVYKLKDKYQESTAILGNLVKPTSQWGPNRDGSSVENLVP